MLMVTPTPTVPALPADPSALVWSPPVIAAGLALLGVFIAQIVIIVQMRVAGKRWRREQTLGMVRWAAELAADENQAKASLGVETLNALGDSSLLVAEDQVLLDAALLTAAEGPYDEETTDDEDEEVDEDAGEEG